MRPSGKTLENDMTKTQEAADVLIAAFPVTNRGHAYKLLANAGLTGSGKVFNAAVKQYEDEYGVTLQKSTAQQRREAESESEYGFSEQTAVNALRDEIRRRNPHFTEEQIDDAAIEFEGAQRNQDWVAEYNRKAFGFEERC